MEKCCILKCPISKNVACYAIPNDPVKRKQWVASINRNASPSSHYSLAELDNKFICSLHFKPSDYVYLIGDDQSSRREISQEAVPSIFPWMSNWDSNCVIEMEFAKLSDVHIEESISQTSTLNTSGLPDGEAVQIGNVESLGIGSQVIEELQPQGVIQAVSKSQISEGLDFPVVKKFKKQAPEIKLVIKNWQSTDVPSEVSDDDVHFDRSFVRQLKYNFSCMDCSFKSSNPISLKEHRMKNHQSPLPKSVHSNMISVTKEEVKNISEVTTPGNSASIQRTITPSGRVVSCYFDKLKRHKYYVCKICSCTFKNTRQLFEHEEDKHSELENVDSPILKSIKQKTDGSAINSYVCTASSSSSKSLEPTNNKKSITLRKMNKSEAAEAILRELKEKNIKKLRKGDGRFYYFCPNCSYNSKDRTRLYNHLENAHSPQGSPPSATFKHETIQKSKKNHVREEKKIINTETKKKPLYFCQMCDFATATLAGLIVHKKLHNKIGAAKCPLCSYSTDLRRVQLHLKRDHRKNRTTELSKPNVASGSTKSNSPESDIEHLCSQCGFRTSSRTKFLTHQKSHIPNEIVLSAEELSIDSSKTEEEVIPKREVEEDDDEALVVSDDNLVNRSVYRCPYCGYWASILNVFHEHVARHQHSPTFKCSVCDFSARYRTDITHHIQKSSKETHETAVWEMMKPLSATRLAKYLTTAMVPKDADYGRIPDNANSTAKLPITTDQPLLDEETSSLSAHQNSDDSMHEWVPSENSSTTELEEEYSSSQSYLTTPDLSSESEGKVSSSSFVTSEDKTDQEDDDDDEARKSKKRKISSPSSPRKRRVCLRSSTRTSSSIRSRRRISSEHDFSDTKEAHQETSKQADSLSCHESDQESNQVPEKTVHLIEHENDTNCREITPSAGGSNDTIDQLEPTKTFFDIKPAFPSVQCAVSKRHEIEQTIAEMDKALNVMRSKQEALEKSDESSSLEITELLQSKNSIRDRLAKLKNQKIEAELQVRQKQCAELKLSLLLTMCETDQAIQEGEKALADCKAEVAKLETDHNLITREMASLELEHDKLILKLKCAQESRGGASQLVSILKSEITETEAELNNFKTELEKTETQIKEVVANERSFIKAQAEFCEAELKVSYMRALSKVRQRERDWLNALDNFVERKCESPSDLQEVNLKQIS